MLICSSKIPVNESLTAEIFIDYATEWVLSGRKYTFPTFVWDGSEDFAAEGEKGELFRVGLFDGGKICAVHFIRYDDRQDKWTADFVLNTEKGVLAFQLYRDASESEYISRSYSLPNLVRKLISAGFCQSDNGLEICGKPLIITRENISLASELILSRAEYSLPVIYISCVEDGKWAVDGNKLADKLNGIAHVMLESGRDVSRELKYRTDGHNPYMGGAEIFYPKGSRRFPPDQLTGYTVLSDAVVQHINQLVIEDDYLWSHLLAEKLSRKLTSEAREFSELSVMYEEILKNKDEEIQNLKNQVYSANSIIDKMSSVSVEKPTEGTPVILLGEEKDLYPEEQKMFLMEFLEREQKMALEGTRRKHILDSIVEANRCEKSLDAIRDRMKSCLKGYSRMTPSLEHELNDIGFTVTGDGKHYKLIFCGDGRYQGTLSKTASDRRSGQHLASDLIKKLFQ